MVKHIGHAKEYSASAAGSTCVALKRPLDEALLTVLACNSVWRFLLTFLHAHHVLGLPRPSALWFMDTEAKGAMQAMPAG